MAERQQQETPRWLLATAVMLTTIMVILDTTIVNVSLPHMMGALGATSDQITWVLTTYIVANAIFIPMTGHFATLLGRKRLLLISITGFVISSGMCGQAHSLVEMVVFRAFQGAFGAPVIPLSQAVLVDAFPPQERGRAMGLWGIGVMLGPILGPTLGGYITETINWRWVFYINVPVGVANVLMVMRYLPGAEARRAPADWWGALLMALGIGSMQLMLDRGNEDNWFDSGHILALTLISAVSLVWFVVRSWGRDDAILQIDLLKDRNLALSSGMMAVFGLGMFGTVILQPIMLEQLFDYPAQTTGLVMAPRGLGAAFTMFMVSRLIGRVDARVLILIGLCLSSLGAYIMTGYNLEIDRWWIIWPSVVQGLGLGMIFVPVTTLAYDTLPQAATDHAAALFNLSRTVGSSIGISIAGTVLSRETQVNWNQLAGYTSPFNPAFHHWLTVQGQSVGDPHTARLLANMVSRQATMVALVDAFWFITISMIALAPLVFLLRKAQRRRDHQGPAAMS